MDFVAIDFETANSKRDSACALGIAIVKENKVIERKSWLIKPNKLEFYWYNIKIHGITEDDVIDKPEFNEIWPELKPYLENNIIVAHNASFDISVLRGLSKIYKFDMPQTKYICTRKLARKLWPGLASYKLYTVAKRHLKINFKHHDPSDDAYACAMILIKAIQALNIKDETELLNVIAPIYTRHESLRFKDIITNKTEFDENNLFYNKTIVFTGTLESMARREAMQRVLDVGGKCGDTLIKETNYLVMGIQDYEKFADGEKSSKFKKAEKLISEGKDLEVITEDEFLNML